MSSSNIAPLIYILTLLWGSAVSASCNLEFLHSPDYYDQSVVLLNKFNKKSPSLIQDIVEMPKAFKCLLNDPDLHGTIVQGLSERLIGGDFRTKEVFQLINNELNKVYDHNDSFFKSPLFVFLNNIDRSSGHPATPFRRTLRYIHQDKVFSDKIPFKNQLKILNERLIWKKNKFITTYSYDYLRAFGGAPLHVVRYNYYISAVKSINSSLEIYEIVSILVNCETLLFDFFNANTEKKASLIEDVKFRILFLLSQEKSQSMFHKICSLAYFSEIRVGLFDDLKFVESFLKQHAMLPYIAPRKNAYQFLIGLEGKMSNIKYW